jgi:hypothetical protein
MLRRVVWYKFTDVSEMLTSCIIRVIIVLMMEAVNTSETSGNFYETKTNSMEQSPS